MLSRKEIRSDAELKRDGFNQDDIKKFKDRAEEYFGLVKQHEDATQKEDWETVVTLEPKIETFEWYLLYTGKHPREIPVNVLKSWNQVPDGSAWGHDPVNLKYKARIKNPATSIRAFCISCMSGQLAEVRACSAVTCPLWAFRMGTNPFFGKVLPPVKPVEVAPEDVDDVEVEEEDTDESASE